MSNSITQEQADAVNRMPAEQRYDFFISKAITEQQVWGLASDEGWVILPEDGEEVFPVWPYAELAELWRSGEFSDCQPKAIPLADWLEKWLPGMQEDGLLAAVCPDSEGDAIIVGAEELLENLENSRQ